MIIWYVFVCCYLSWIAYVDLKTMKIRNSSLKILLFLGTIHSVFIGEFKSSIKGFLFGGIFFLVIYFLSKGGLGEGDIKLVAILGLFLGFEKLIIGIFIACLIQLIVRLFYKLSSEVKYPFAPAICLGCIISWFWGFKIIFSVI